MNYRGAEIAIRDVNLKNSQIFNDGWMYVSQPNRKAKEALYFAPYFTNEVENPGISVISCVVYSKIGRLADISHVGVNPPSEEHRSRWDCGLSMLHKRAREERFLDKEAMLFYLDRPIEVWKPPIRKKPFNERNPFKRIPDQIPIGFSLRFDDLRSYAQPLGGC